MQKDRSKPYYKRAFGLVLHASNITTFAQKTREQRTTQTFSFLGDD